MRLAGVKILKAPKKSEPSVRPSFVPESKAATQKPKPAPKLVSKPAPAKKPEPVKKVRCALCNCCACEWPWRAASSDEVREHWGAWPCKSSLSSSQICYVLNAGGGPGSQRFEVHGAREDQHNWPPSRGSRHAPFRGPSCCHCLPQWALWQPG